MKKKKSRKQWIAGGIGAAVTAVVYASLLPLNRPIHFLIFGALCAGVGWVVYTMSGGLDTSQKAPTQRPFTATGNPTVDQLIQRGMEMLRQIREENAAIPDEELSAKMDKLEESAKRILTTVADKPEKAPQIRRFMDYYLPTVSKMLTSYRKLEERGVTGENAEKMKKTVEDAMDVVLDAFRKQHDQLYQAETLDVTTDVQVLETLLKQDGLLDSGLHDAPAAGPSAAESSAAEPSAAAQAVLKQ